MVNACCRIGFEAEFWFVDPDDSDRETEDRASWASRRIVAKLLEEDLGKRVVAPRAERGRKRWRDWQVLPEYNLDPLFVPDDVLCGVEIVSPPLTVDEFEISLRTICDFVMCFGHTDLNCGVHFNVSVPKIDQLDLVKLGLLTPDIELLRRFKRCHHPGILSFRHELAARASECQRYLGANSQETGLQTLRTLLPVGKQTSLNLKPWCDGRGYVEFRQCGGTDWQYRYNVLLEAARSCVESVQAACDPTSHRRSLSARERQLRNEATLLKQGELSDYARLRQREPDWVRHLLVAQMKRLDGFVSVNEPRSAGPSGGRSQ